MTPRSPFPVLVRVAWLAVVLVALWYLGVGLDKNFYFEPTSEALDRAAVGIRMVWASTLALVAAAGFAWWAGAPRWSSVVLLLPALCGGLLLVWPEQALGWLAFFVAGPVSGLAGVVAVRHRWDRRAERTVDAAT